MGKTPLVARVFYSVLVLPDFDPNGSGIPDFAHTYPEMKRTQKLYEYVPPCRSTVEKQILGYEYYTGK